MYPFVSLYFKDEVASRLNCPERYDNGGFVENDPRHYYRIWFWQRPFSTGFNAHRLKPLPKCKAG